MPRLNGHQFGEQLRLFPGYTEEQAPSYDPEKVLGPAHGTTAGGRRYWMTGEPQPGSHPGQGKLFRNDMLKNHYRYD